MSGTDPINESVFPCNPTNASERLQQLKLVLSQLPWGPTGPEVDISPPNIYDPVVTDIKLRNLNIRQHTITMQIGYIQTELDLLKLINRDVTPGVQNQIAKLIEDIAALQNDMRQYIA